MRWSIGTRWSQIDRLSYLPKGWPHHLRAHLRRNAKRRRGVQDPGQFQKSAKNASASASSNAPCPFAKLVGGGSGTGYIVPALSGLLPPRRANFQPIQALRVRQSPTLQSFSTSRSSRSGPPKWPFSRSIDRFFIVMIFDDFVVPYQTCIIALHFRFPPPNHSGGGIVLPDPQNGFHLADFSGTG